MLIEFTDVIIIIKSHHEITRDVGMRLQRFSQFKTLPINSTMRSISVWLLLLCEYLNIIEEGGNWCIQVVIWSDC